MARQQGAAQEAAKSNANAAREFFETLEGNEKSIPTPILTPNGVREGTRDPFALTSAERALIPAGLVPKFVRDPKQWKGVEGTDRISEVQSACDGAQVICDGNGQPIKRGTDLVLMAVPEGYHNWSEQQTNEKYRERAKQFKTKQVDEDTEVSEHHEEFFPTSDADFVRQHSEENSQRLRSAGMIGSTSETYGMTLEEFYNRHSDAEIEALQTAARRGALFQPKSREEFHAILGADDEPKTPQKGWSRAYEKGYQEVFGKKSAGGAR